MYHNLVSSPEASWAAVNSIIYVVTSLEVHTKFFYPHSKKQKQCLLAKSKSLTDSGPKQPVAEHYVNVTEIMSRLQTRHFRKGFSGEMNSLSAWTCFVTLQIVYMDNILKLYGYWLKLPLAHHPKSIVRGWANPFEEILRRLRSDRVQKVVDSTVEI